MVLEPKWLKKKKKKRKKEKRKERKISSRLSTIDSLSGQKFLFPDSRVTAR